MAEKLRLDLDLDSLLPGDTFQIGNQSILIRPLGLLQYKSIIFKIRSLMSDLKDKGITGKNYKDPDNLISLVELLVTKFPEILEEASNIHIDDLQVLPIEVLVGLTDKCLEVNLKSKEALIKNLVSLAGKVNSLTETQQQTDLQK